MAGPAALGVLLGAALLTGFAVGQLAHASSATPVSMAASPRPTPPLGWVNRLPENNCTMVFNNGQQLGIVDAPLATYIFALSNESTIIYKYQLPGPSPRNFTDWKTLAGNRTLKFNGNPAAGVNPDGRVEVFFQATDDLDVWQIYQTDPKNPESWSEVRESACVKSKAGGEPIDCMTPDRYWVHTDDPSSGERGSPVFATSNPDVVYKHDGRLQVYFRSFTGLLFKLEQCSVGNSSYYCESTELPLNVYVV